MKYINQYVRRIRSGASRDPHGDVVWLDFMAPHRQLVVDVTVVTSARTNSNVPRIDARLPLPSNLALGAQHCKLDADLCFAWHAFGSVDP
jgi:hypothetical protein